MAPVPAVARAQGLAIPVPAAGIAALEAPVAPAAALVALAREAVEPGAGLEEGLARWAVRALRVGLAAARVRLAVASTGPARGAPATEIPGRPAARSLSGPTG